MSAQNAASNQEAGHERIESAISRSTALSQANVRIKEYLLDNVPTFCELSDLREKGWANPEGDAFFKRQRKQADTADENGRRYLYCLMQRIGTEIHKITKALKVNNTGGTPPRILDMCMAPGGFLESAMRYNPGAHALAFTLPEETGGHEVLLRENNNLETHFVDITMLAEDMGVTQAEIPPEHPEATKFLQQRYLLPGTKFDLVLCDGQVLRTHESHRASYREPREARRLGSTQLALGLEHLEPGGSMIVLLHKLEAWNTAGLLYTFSTFSDIKVIKPTAGHQKRSSFYMIAQNIQSGSQEALAALQKWKREWKIATFSGHEEYSAFLESTAKVSGLGVDELLNEFGPTLAKLGEEVWRVQADALAKAPFMKK